MHRFIGAAIFATTIAAAASPVLAQPAASPFSGTWRLNLAASRFGSHPEKSESRTYVVNGNKVTLTSKGTDGAGKPTAYHYSAAFDGKTYPLVGNPIGNMIALRKINARSVAATVSKGSMLASNSTSMVSADGKRLTLTRTYPGGKLATDVSVYDKQ